MIILVSDTSVLIDLERGALLESAFSCGLTMVVPDLLYARELAAENGPLLRENPEIERDAAGPTEQVSPFRMPWRAAPARTCSGSSSVSQ